MTYLLRTLGSLSLFGGTSPDAEDDPLLGNSKSLALLAYVALAPGREASRGHLARLLWPDSERTQARRSLRQALYYLSKRAGGELLRAEDGAVAVVEDRLDVDVWRFEAALQDGRLEEAVSRYDGAFLEGFGAGVGRELESWIETQNEWIWSGLKAAYHELVNRSIEDEDLERAVRFGRAYVDLNPFDEAAQTTLVRALLARGDRVAAYQQYESFRTLLEEELDDEPEPGLTERIEALQEEIFVEPDPARFARGAGRAPELESGGDRVGPRDDTGPSRQRTDGSPVSGPFHWALAGALAATLLFAVLAAVRSLPVLETRGAPGWEGADGVLRIQHGTNRKTLSEVRIDDGIAEIREIDLEPSSLPSPDGTLVAEKVVTDSGPDIVVRDRRTGELLARAADRADEHVLAWAPDGRSVLFDRSQRLRGDREYRKRLHLLRVSDGSVTGLRDRTQHPNTSWAAWSPRGGRIAFVGLGSEGDKEIYSIDADGSRSRNLTRHPAEDATPSWSPDARWIAFASDRAGDMDLYRVPAEGGDPERLTYGPADETGPVWLDETRIAFRSLRSDDSGEVWLLDTMSGNTRKVAGPFTGGVANLFRDDLPDDLWVDTLTVVGGDVAVAAGQRQDLRVRAATSTGVPVPVEELPVRWSSLDPTVAEVDSTGGVVGRRPGRTAIMASHGGWRTDTVAVRVGATAVRRGLAMVLREDWATGIDDRRWLVAGEPAPRVRTSAGEGVSRRRPMLDPNGDANYLSGVVLREGLDLGEGLTAEVRATVPLTGRLYQVLQVEFFPDSIRGPERWMRGRPGLAGVRIGGARGGFEVLRGTDYVPLQLPEDPGQLHTYALQVESDGTVSVALDGRLLWRSAEPVIDDLDRKLRLRIAGQSLHTDILVDELRLWRGVRYVVADPPDRGFRLVPRTGGPETDVEHTER